ncbi:MAG: ATP-binding protein [Saprospiraceae bacterium]
MDNPFPTSAYTSPEYFCDRDTETKKIIAALDNHRNLTLHSIRRIGKTGLIHHVFEQLKSRKDIITVYVDIMDTTSEAEFMQKFIAMTLQTFYKESKGLLKNLSRAFSKYKPKITLDPLTGMPAVELDIVTKSEVNGSLRDLMTEVKKRKETIVISLDEFQQIEKYESGRIAATLREYVQLIPNLRFIFSGSEQGLLLNMFVSPKHALYRSTQLFGLEKIEPNIYKKFICNHFLKRKKKIEQEQIKDILSWTCTHTFYTQYFCNRLFEKAQNIVRESEIAEVKKTIFKENEYYYYNYKRILSFNQWKLLTAIAKEESIVEITSKDFISKYKLGAHSTVKKSAIYLVENELLYTTHDDEKEKLRYHMYDPFLMRWIQSKNYT